MTHVLALLAQTTSRPATPPPPPSMWNMLIPMLGMILVFYWFTMRGGRKDQKRLQDMLAHLKRNDRVQTIGGVRGTVVDVRDDEVVLKVDEANNVRMRFARSAIKEVFADSPPAAKK